MQRKRKQRWLAGNPDTATSLLHALERTITFRSLVCILRNSKYASTSIVCTLRNSKCAFRIKIQNTHFAVVWKQSKTQHLITFLMFFLKYSFHQFFPHLVSLFIFKLHSFLDRWSSDWSRLSMSSFATIRNTIVVNDQTWFITNLNLLILGVNVFQKSEQSFVEFPWQKKKLSTFFITISPSIFSQPPAFSVFIYFTV